MINAVLRGDLRARTSSRKIIAIEVFYLAVLGVLAWLGLPPELNPQTSQPETSLTMALLVVQAIVVTYFASACAAQEIAVEGEKSTIDLTFAPFSPGTIVAGKSAATLATVAYWVALGAPLVMLAAGVRQDPPAGLARAGLFIVLLAWSVGQMGLWLGTAIESEFARTLAHWGMLVAIFAGTMALPGSARVLNPVIALAAAQTGTAAAPFLAYAAFGLMCDGAARRSLRRYAAA